MSTETTISLTKADLYLTCWFCWIGGVAVGMSIMGITWLRSMP